MSIDNLKSSLPEYAKDQKLNLGHPDPFQGPGRGAALGLPAGIGCRNPQ